jgi:Domain of unknown function (DUF4124)
MRTLAFTLLCLACSLALAATVYRWVDENGVVHYSDQPHPNAEKLQVHAAQTYKPSALDAPSAGGGASSSTSSSSSSPYRGCAVVQPPAGQSYANVDSLTVVVQTDPQLHPGDKVYVMVDGQAVNGGAPSGPQFVLSPVERGSHTVQAQVKDAGGAIMCQTPTVTFEVHQNSILNPNNPRVTPH